MPQFASEGLSIAYETRGDGPPVVLVHGFASSRKVNWVDTGWMDAVAEAGYRAIALDNRGHGESEKIYDPERYGARDMARDVVGLIDHLSLSHAALIGYSMGARICAFCAIDAPDKVSAAVFGGLGEAMISGMRDSQPIIDALLAENVAAIDDRGARQYRLFADSTGSDRKALAACMKGSRVPIDAAMIATITAPVLVAVGTRDAVSGPPGPLADLMERGEVLAIEGRDHMRATGDPQFKRGALDFLARVYPPGA